MKLSKTQIIFAILVVILSIIVSLVFRNSQYISLENLASFDNIFVNYKEFLKEIILISLVLGITISSGILFYEHKALKFISLLPSLMMIILSYNLITFYLGISLLLGTFIWVLFPTPLLIKNYFSKVSSLSYYASSIYSKANLIFFILILIYLFNNQTLINNSFNNYFKMAEVSMSDDELKKLIADSLKKQQGISITTNDVPQEMVDQFKNEIKRNQETVIQSIKEKIQQNEKLRVLLLFSFAGLFSFYIFLIFLIARFFGFVYFMLVAKVKLLSEDSNNFNNTLQN
ncbi:MAG: hypothetical protein QXR30_00055 [Candidatus Woesearchaeota archaeon]